MTINALLQSKVQVIMKSNANNENKKKLKSPLSLRQKRDKNQLIVFNQLLY